MERMGERMARIEVKTIPRS
jgi:hypothetical protein